MIRIKTRAQVEKMRDANLSVAEVLAVLTEMTRPGITTLDLERRAEKEARKRGVRPAFKGYRGYPFCLCTSVNEEVVHGMPSERELKEGDIVGIDFGVERKGFYGDSAVTLPVGAVSDEATRLMRVAERSLELAIETMRPGGRMSELSLAVQGHVESNGFSVVRAFVGHGIGSALHEDPQVPNFLIPGHEVVFKEGMVLAIEPMVNAGGMDVEVLADGWTAVTKDRSFSAHFEHSVAVTKSGPYVLSRL